MGIRVRNSGAVGVGLRKHAKRSTRALRRVHFQASQKIADVASQMAPRDKENLEGNIVVERQTGSDNRVTYIVHTNGVSYAVYMHESTYNLGPRSVAKNESSRFRVGRKFLERAVDYVLFDLGFLQKARRAVRMK